MHGSDEYILPKIAEKDLRRFANLRSNTSNLGFNIPLQEVCLFLQEVLLSVVTDMDTV